MNLVDEMIEPYTTSYTPHQQVFIIAREASGKEYRGVGEYSGAGNFVPVNYLENIFIPIFSCPNIPQGHYKDISISPILERENNPT